MNKLSPRLSFISLCLMSAYSFSTHAEGNKQTTVLDEITVTGEKFERSQSSTGSSTSVVTPINSNEKPIYCLRPNY